MKFSLRNLALAGVMTLAGVAMAQDAPFTVTKNWEYTGATTSKNDARFGTGVNGAVYFNEKAEAVIKKIDANGVSNFASVTGLGTACSADDAGNLLVNTGFPGAGSGGAWVIVAADGTQTPLSITAPAGIAIGRLDQQGRVIGDMLSEEGALAFLCQNGAPELQLVYIKNGAQADLLDYMTTDNCGFSINTSSVAQPIYTFAETMDMGDDAVNAVAFRNRSTKNVNLFEGGEATVLPAPTAVNTTEGFDVFMLGDKLYQVVPTVNGNTNYDGKLVIADEEGTVVWESDLACTGNNSQSFGSVAARKIDDNTVELYQYYVAGDNNISAAQWTISDKAEEPEPAVAPEVYKKWQYIIEPGTYNSGNSRFGTGYDGKIYFADKANNKLMVMDAKGVKTFADFGEASPACGVGASADDAGNILVNRDFPNAGSSTDFFLVKPDGSFSEVTLAVPEDVTEEALAPARIDGMGRIVGDVTSEEGAFFFQAPSGKTDAWMVYMQNGAQAKHSDIDYYNFKAPNSLNTSTVIQPMGSFEEMNEAGDDACSMFAYRNRSVNGGAFQLADETVLPMGGLTGDGTEGGDVFTFNDVLYQVVPVKNGTAHCGNWAVISEEGEVLFQTSDDFGATGSQGFGSLVARKVSDSRVDLYHFYMLSTGKVVGEMYYVTTDGEDAVEPEPEVAHVYMTGANTTPSWNPAEPVELEYADGVYTTTITKAGEFKLSTAKGDWGAFNAGVLGVEGGVLKVGETYPIIKSEANLSIAKDGEYTLTVDLVNNTIALTGSAVYPEALYLIGNVNGNGWNPGTVSAKLTRDEEDGWYRAEDLDFYDNYEGYAWFGITSVVDSNWDVVNANRYGASENDLVIEAYQAVPMYMNGNAWKVKAGKYDIAVNLDNMTFNLAEVVEPQIAVKYWTNYGDTEMEPEAQVMMMTEGSEGGEYFLYQDVMMGQFYFTTELGVRSTLWGCADESEEAYTTGVEVKVGEDVELAPEGGFFKVPGQGILEAMIKVKFTSDGAYVNIEGTVVPNEEPEPESTDKAHFAYNVKHEDAGNGVYNIKFHSTGDAHMAVLVLNDGEDHETEVELGRVVKGENTFTYDASKLPADKEHSWAVRLHNYEVTETKVSEPVSVGGARAGLCVFVDPAYPEVYGKVVIGRTGGKGIDVYAADGTLEKTINNQVSGNAFHASGSANNSSPMDAKPRGNEAVFASWGDTSYGVVAVDITTEDIYSVFEGTKAGDGSVTNAAGEFVGSGTPCLAFQGTGDDTKLFTFDEDGFANSIAMNPIGDNKTTSKAAENWGYKNTLANTNVGMWPAEKGLWLSQIRGNGMETGTPSLAYLDIESQEILWRAADMIEEDETFVPSSTAGVCVNPAGDLLALTNYGGGVQVFLLSWDENAMGDVVPVLEKYDSFVLPGAGNNRCNIQFDAANNLHITNQTGGYYVATLAEKEPIALTAAHSQYVIKNTSAVANIAVDAANGNAVYYNLNGVRVSGKLAAGVYVKVVDGKATKVVVK